MALSSSAEAEVQRPLATVVMGGLVSATFPTPYRPAQRLNAFLYRKEEPPPIPSSDDIVT